MERQGATGLSPSPTSNFHPCGGFRWPVSFDRQSVGAGHPRRHDGRTGIPRRDTNHRNVHARACTYASALAPDRRRRRLHAAGVARASPHRRMESWHELLSKIAITSTRDNPTQPLLGAEIYLINPDGTDPQRLTNNFPYGDLFPMLSPDGKKIVFDSNRLTADFTTDTLNISDLFVMDADGTKQTLLTEEAPQAGRRTARTSFSTPQLRITHLGGRETGDPIKGDPGAATEDSDLFVAKVNELNCRPRPVPRKTRASDEHHQHP